MTQYICLPQPDCACPWHLKKRVEMSLNFHKATYHKTLPPRESAKVKIPQLRLKSQFPRMPLATSVLFCSEDSFSSRFTEYFYFGHPCELHRTVKNFHPFWFVWDSTSIKPMSPKIPFLSIIFIITLYAWQNTKFFNLLAFEEELWFVFPVRNITWFSIQRTKLCWNSILLHLEGYFSGGLIFRSFGRFLL